MVKYKLWEISVQKDSKPYTYEKVRLIAELDQKTANNVFERSIKHPAIAENILWLSFKLEKKYGIPAMTFCMLENYQWVKASS